MLSTMQPIRVCHLTSSHRALDTRIFNREAVSLSKNGYQVTVVGKHPINEVVEEIKIIPLDKKWNNRIYMLFSIMGIALRQRADLYHFHDPDLIIIGLILKLLGKKVIYDVHEDYKQVILSREYVPQKLRKMIAGLFTNFEQFASGFFDFMVVVDSNIQSKFPVQKTEIVTNFPPSAKFLQIKQNKLINKQFNIVFLGTLSNLRGAAPIIDALKLSRYKNDIRLHILGRVAENLVSLHNDNSQVTCHGYIPWEQAHNMLVDADMGLLLYQPTPAYSTCTWEGCTKLFEYLGSGLPVIYSDFPNLRKLVEPIGCGIAVNPRDSQKIAEAIDILYENPQLRAELGIKGWSAVQDKYKWEIEEQKLLAVYARVITSS